MSAFRPAAVLAAFSRASEEAAPRMPGTARAAIERADRDDLRRSLRRAIGYVTAACAIPAALRPGRVPAGLRPSRARPEAALDGPPGSPPALASHFDLLQAPDRQDELGPIPVGEAA